MRRMHVCQILFPDPLSGSTYTERSSHSVRVGEKVSVCAMTMCVCVTYLSGHMLAGISVCRDASTTDCNLKHFRSQLQGDMASSFSLTSALPLFSRKTSMACSTLRYHDNPPPAKGGREDPLVDVRHEGTATKHNWPSFPVYPSHKGCIPTSVLAPTDNRNSTTASWPA